MNTALMLTKITFKVSVVCLFGEPLYWTFVAWSFPETRSWAWYVVWGTLLFFGLMALGSHLLHRHLINKREQLYGTPDSVRQGMRTPDHCEHGSSEGDGGAGKGNQHQP